MRWLKKKIILFFLIIGLIVFLATRQVTSMVNPPTPLLKNDNGRINILILGTGGENHDGPDLTDTMIVASLTPDIITTISIPRDIYSYSLESKINQAYSLGKAQETVTEITGLPIHYFVKIDFSVFEKIIDILEGIDINVPVSFDDYQYPITSKENDLCNGDWTFACRYEHLHFDAGWQHMNGKIALKYVRSRHAEGDEGTDFARAARQQLVINAVRNKILSTQNIFNISKGLGIYNQIKTNLVTDLDIRLLASGLNYKNATIKNVVLGETLFDNPPEDYRGWILLPKNGDWSQIHQFIQEQIKTTTPTPTPLRPLLQP